MADSSCLIGLAFIERFKLLKDLFGFIYIPDAVYNEVVLKGKKEVGSNETQKAINNGWIKRKVVKDRALVEALAITLGRGESEVIALCKELDADYALIDEKNAKDIAELMNVDTMGVIGTIDLAVKKGFEVDKRKLVDQLRNKGFRVSDELYRKMFPD